MPPHPPPLHDLICGHCKHYHRLYLFIKTPGRCNKLKIMGVPHDSNEAARCEHYLYRKPLPTPKKGWLEEKKAKREAKRQAERQAELNKATPIDGLDTQGDCHAESMP